MKQTISILKNKDGNAIVIAMMILVLLTIIGTSATRNTTVELQIVRNFQPWRIWFQPYLSVRIPSTLRI
ncbi:MAG: pilus assembly PilX N-terminal domain-containing protein [Planctomycetota bacterium]